MRRVALLVSVVAVAALVALAPSAGAQVDSWDGSGWGPSDTYYTSPPQFTAHFQINAVCNSLYCEWIDYTEIKADGMSSDSCPLPLVGQWYDDHLAVRDVAATLDFACNGVYTIIAGAHRARSTGPAQSDDVKVIALYNITIAVPAAPVQSVTAAANSNAVTVTWVPADGYAAASSSSMSSSSTSTAQAASTLPGDFQGYQVNRVTSSGKTTVVANVGADTTSVVDKDVPDGAYFYEVQSLRAGAEPTSVRTAKAVTVAKSAPPNSSSSDLPPPVITDTTPTIPRSPTTTSSSVFGVPAHPRTATAPTSAGAKAPAVEADEGFDSSLPYESEPGSAEASGPSVRASNKEPGAGLLVPFAVSQLLVVWALHVLYVTRQARYAEAGLLPIHLEHDS